MNKRHNKSTKTLHDLRNPFYPQCQDLADAIRRFVFSFSNNQNDIENDPRLIKQLLRIRDISLRIPMQKRNELPKVDWGYLNDLIVFRTEDVNFPNRMLVTKRVLKSFL